MAVFETWIESDLQKMIVPRVLPGNTFCMDSGANLIGVSVMNGGEPAELSGTVAGKVVRSDGTTVPVTGGTLSGNRASIILPQRAYEVPGPIAIAVTLTSGSTVTTIGAVTGYVVRSQTDSIIDPGTILPTIDTLINQIQTAIDSIPADYSQLIHSIAPSFSSSTAYSAGDMVWYPGEATNPGALYRFTSAHAAGEWTGSDATAAVFANELSSLKSALNTIETRTPPINQWDEEWEVGGINGSTGANGTTTDKIRSINYIPVKSSTTYYFKMGSIVGGGSIFCYGSDKSYLGVSTLISGKSGTTFTTDSNTKYIRFSTPTSYGTTYNNDISINYPSTYEGYYPYTKSKIQYDFDNYAPLNHIGTGAILRDKLGDSYQNTIKRLLDTGDDLNSYTKPDILFATANCLHTPDDSHSWYVQVLYIPWQNGARYTSIQVAYRQDSPNIVQTRIYDSKSDSWNGWISNEITAISRAMLTNTYMNTSLNLYSGDVNNKLVPDVFYSVAGNAHNPNSTENFLFVVLNAPWQNNAKQTIAQIAMAIGGSNNVFYRTYQSYNTTWSDWSGINQNSILSGKKVVFLGDSTYAIAGGDGSKIPGWVKKMTSADTYNCAFGGTRISDSRTDPNDKFQYFDFPALCDAIVSGSFTVQENNIPSSEASAFTSQLATLKDVTNTIGWANVDILCIEYGTNDYTSDVQLGTVSSDKTTVMGGLLYCVNKLLTAFPNLTIFVDGIRYRAFPGSGVYEDDAYNHINGLSKTITEYADAIRDAAYSVGLPYSDNLRGYGWNKYNLSTYFPTTDYTHFNSTGAKFAAKILVNKLSGLGGIY